MLLCRRYVYSAISRFHANIHIHRVLCRITKRCRQCNGMDEKIETGNAAIENVSQLIPHHDLLFYTGII